MNLSIPEKLKLIREGSSLENVNVSINENFDSMLESISLDINFIIESTIEFMIESDDDSSIKNKLKKMIDWLISKVKQFFSWIKQKLHDRKKKINDTADKYRSGKVTVEVNEVGVGIHQKVLTNTVNINSIIDKIHEYANNQLNLINKGEEVNNDHLEDILKIIGVKDNNFKSYETELLGKDDGNIKINNSNAKEIVNKMKTFSNSYDLSKIENLLTEINKNLAEIQSNLNGSSNRKSDEYKQYRESFLLFNSASMTIAKLSQVTSTALKDIENILWHCKTFFEEE
jgi:ElaB/YqjD/DUF883 family membrane-anchored ribosome-binding protein/soluble cytochrome b562